MTNQKEYKKLLKAVVAYRNTMMEKLNISTNEYFKIYSEQRATGMRTKFWGMRNGNTFTKIVKYIKKNPNVKVGYNLYSVKANQVISLRMSSHSMPDAVNIGFKFSGKSK